MRARVTIRGLVPLGEDGADVAVGGVEVVPWTELEWASDIFDPEHAWFRWVDVRGRVVRHHELGRDGSFKVTLERADGTERRRSRKRSEGEEWEEGGRGLASERRRVTVHRVWRRAVTRAVRDGSLVVVRDQRRAWRLEVAIWGLVLAVTGVFTGWWFEAHSRPLLSAGDSASTSRGMLTGIVCLSALSCVVFLIRPRLGVIFGKVARWSRVDASGVCAGWSPKRATLTPWIEIKEVRTCGDGLYRLVNQTGSKVTLSISERGLAWMDEMHWGPLNAAIKAANEAALAAAEEPVVEGDKSQCDTQDESPLALDAFDAETHAALAAARHAMELRIRRGNMVGCLVVGFVVGALCALAAYGLTDGSWKRTVVGGAGGFVMGAVLLPLAFGVVRGLTLLMALVGRWTDTAREPCTLMVPARITLAGLAPADAARRAEIGVAPWTELWQGPRGYEWRDAERRWVRIGGGRKRVIFTLTDLTPREEYVLYEWGLEGFHRRAARGGRLSVVIDQRAMWWCEAVVLGIESVVPLICAAAALTALMGPVSSWEGGVALVSGIGVGSLLMCAAAVCALALTRRHWDELLCSPTRVRGDATGLVLRMVTGRSRRVTWEGVRRVSDGETLKFETRTGPTFWVRRETRLMALLDARGARVGPTSRGPSDLRLRLAVRYALIIGFAVGVIGIYARASNGQAVFPSAAFAGMLMGGFVFAVFGAMVVSMRLRKKLI